MANLLSKDLVEEEDLEALKRVVLSMSWSVSQLIRESATSLANATLKRRDNFIKSLPSFVTDDMKLGLRTTDVFSEVLFDEAKMK